MNAYVPGIATAFALLVLGCSPRSTQRPSSKPVGHPLRSREYVIQRLPALEDTLKRTLTRYPGLFGSQNTITLRLSVRASGHASIGGLADCAFVDKTLLTSIRTSFGVVPFLDTIDANHFVTKIAIPVWRPADGSVAFSMAGVQVEHQAVRTPAEIRSTLRTMRRYVRRFYENAVREDSLLNGRIRVKLTIPESGLVEDVSIVTSSLSSAAFEQKLLDYIATWEFGYAEGVEPVTMELPLVFDNELVE